MSEKKAALSEYDHGIWQWDGRVWVVKASSFPSGEPPCDPNHLNGVQVRGSYVNQYMIFPLTFTIGNDDDPNQVEATLPNGQSTGNMCICECQNGIWVPTQSSCTEGVATCSLFTDACQAGDAPRVGTCA